MRTIVVFCLGLYGAVALGQASAPAPIVYFDIAAKLEEIVARGGVVDAPRFEVPGVVVLGLFTDPAGNPMALVEMQDGIAVVP